MEEKSNLTSYKGLLRTKTVPMEKAVKELKKSMIDLSAFIKMTYIHSDEPRSAREEILRLLTSYSMTLQEVGGILYDTFYYLALDVEKLKKMKVQNLRPKETNNDDESLNEE